MSNGPFDALLEQVTGPLRVDPELRLEVRRELLIHLEDATAEYERGGYAPEQARATAMRALGEPEKLAQELYQAHRSRLRWRKVGRRFALVALVPLAVLVVFWPVIERSWEQSFVPPALAYNSAVQNIFRGIFVKEFAKVIAHLPEEKRFLFYGNPGDETSQQIVQSIARRWPDNPVYLACALPQRLTDALGWIDAPGVYHSYSPAEMRQHMTPVLADITRGQQLEPDNAFFDYLQADALLSLSTERVAEHGPTVKEIKQDSQGNFHIEEQREDELRINDAPMFAQALAAFQRAVRKPEMNPHTQDLLQQRLDALGSPHTLLQVIGRAAVEIDTLLPHLAEMRRTTNSLRIYALTQAQQGHQDSALSLLNDVELAGTQMTRTKGCLIEILVARSIQAAAESGRMAIYDQLHQTNQAQVEQDRLRHWYEWRNQMTREHNSPDSLDYRRRSGVLLSALTPSVAGYRPDPDPLRSAEYALVEKMALALSMRLWIMLAALGWLVMMMMVVGERQRADKTPFIWIGWRRLAWIGLWALVVPVAVYALYVGSPWSGRQWGLWITWPRVLIEHLALWVVTLGLLIVLARRALRQRVMELGLPWRGPYPWDGSGAGVAEGAPARPGRWMRRSVPGLLARVIILTATFVFLEIAVVGMEGLWHFQVAPVRQALQQLMLILVVIVAIGWVAAEIMIGAYRRPTSLLVRALPPVLALAVIVTAGLGYAGTSWLERSAVRRAVQQGGLYDFTHEVDHSAYRELRDDMARRYRELTAMAAPAPASSMPMESTREATPKVTPATQVQPRARTTPGEQEHPSVGM